MHEDIKDYPLLENVFKLELDRILNIVNVTTTTSYFNLNNSTISAFSDILQQIKNLNNEYVNKIKTSLIDTIQVFLISNKNNLDILYESWEEFHKNIIPELNNHKEEFKKNSSLTFDLGLYYNIKDILSSILSIYQNFINN